MRDELDVQRWQQRLLVLGVVVPLASIVALHLLMDRVLEPRWPNHSTTIAWVAGALGLVVFATAMFWMIDRGRSALLAQNQARLEAERRLAVVTERERIAREMHDSLAQVLGATHLRLRALAYRDDVGPGARDELDDIAATCHEAYADVREAILGLREGSRTDRTFLESLDAYLRAFQRSSGIETLLVNQAGDDPDLDPMVEVQLIRVLQEALTNVRKHAGARHAVVELSPSAEGLRFTVSDDGRGFVPGSAPTSDGGYGMQTMRERTEMVGGRLSIDSSPGGGTRVHVDLPAFGEAARVDA